MLLRRTSLLIATLLLLAAPHAVAEEAEVVDFEADREAGYLSLSYRYSDTDLSSKIGEGHGFSIATGIRMVRWASAELEADYQHSLNTFNIKRDDVWSVTGNIKAILPLGPQDRIQPYILVGVGVMSYSETAPDPSNEDFQGVFKVGGGLDYFLTRHWVANGRITWVSSMKSTKFNYTSFNVGLSYVFR